MQQENPFGEGQFLLDSTHRNQREACAVPLAPSLNLVAICAVFVFVGAILLGMF
jgi:hypothetical protein